MMYKCKYSCINRDKEGNTNNKPAEGNAPKCQLCLAFMGLMVSALLYFLDDYQAAFITFIIIKK